MSHLTFASVEIRADRPLSGQVAEGSTRPESYHDQIHLVLRIISALGFAIGVAMAATNMMPLGIAVASLSSLFAVGNEFFRSAFQREGEATPLPDGRLAAAIPSLETVEASHPSAAETSALVLGQAPAFPTPPIVRRVIGPSEIFLLPSASELISVSQSRVSAVGEGITMPDPGTRLEGTGINPQHFVETLAQQRNAPRAPDVIREEHIKGFLHRINFTYPDAPCYVFDRNHENRARGSRPDNASYERYQTSTEINLVRLASDLEHLVNKVVTSTDENTRSFFRYIIYKYALVEQNLIDPVSEDYIEDSDPRIVEGSSSFDETLKRRRDFQIKEVDARNQGIMQLIAGAADCANRMRTETYEVYRRVLGLRASDLETDVKNRLEELRFNLLTLIASHQNRPVILPELSRSLQYLLGPTRGIMEHVFLEEYPNRPYAPQITEDEAYEEFNRCYNRRTLVETVQEWFDGVGFIRERGRGVSEIAYPRIHTWFATHLPVGRNREAFLSEDVYRDYEGGDLRIKEGAVAYFLKNIGVITEEAVDRRYC